MASNVSIANRAAVKLGCDRIISLSDNTQVARTFNSMFDAIIQEELRRNRWKFAIKRDSLLALVDAPAWGYAYQYPLPADYESILNVGEYHVRSFFKQQAPWSIEGGLILTDLAAPLKIRYIFKVTNPGTFDPLFAEVIACKLAAEACVALTQSSSKKEQFIKEYQAALEQACMRDAVEMEPDYLPDGSWLDSRTSGTFASDAGPWQAYPSGV